MNSITLTFGKDKTAIIKGIAIIFMIMLHCCVADVLFALGDVSVYMWFFHALFFTSAIKAVYEPFINISDSLWIVTPWTIFLTFVCSWGIMKAVNIVLSKITK